MRIRNIYDLHDHVSGTSPNHVSNESTDKTNHCNAMMETSSEFYIAFAIFTSRTIQDVIVG